MHLIAHVLVHSLLDTLSLVPFLLVTYLAMEAIEHSASAHVRRAVERSGKAGPVVGALLGALPQCGFSAMAATLYAGGVVTAGTLVAVILSTSDEMVPVFLAHQAPAGQMAAILAVKVVVGLVVGLAIDVALRSRRHGRDDDGRSIHELCERAHCHCDDALGGASSADAPFAAACAPAGEKGHAHDHEHDDAHAHGHAHGDAHEHDHDGHGHAHGHGRWAIVPSALDHTVQVSGYILVVTFAFGLVMELVGRDALAGLLADHPVRATFLSALVGLVPNCGASVAITELYLDGVLACGPMLAGLLASGGVGLFVLWKTNVSVRRSVAVTAVVYVVAVAVGLAAGALGVVL